MIYLIFLYIIAFFCKAEDSYIRPLDRTSCPIPEELVFKMAENTEANYVEYRLYTRLNPENYEIIKDPRDILQSNYNPNYKTIFLVHGYGGSSNDPWSIHMKSVLLQQYNYNVIIVDWEYGAGKFYAPYAIAHAYATGKEIAKFIDFIASTNETSLDRFHLIGFSLGAQVVAYAGKNLNKVGRITALDPAGPCFILFSPKYRILHTDADFVDVIVTNAGGYGLAVPSGHIYFAINGGRTQKTCGSQIVSKIENGDIDKLVLDSCSHHKAPKYFTESMLKQQCLMVGYKCDDYSSFKKGKCAECGKDGKKCALMGMNADVYIPKIENKTQIFFMETNFEFPYCLFHYQVKVKISNINNMHQVGKLQLLLEGENQRIFKNLNEYSELLEPGGIYTYLITNSFDIDPLISIRFKWYRMSTEFTDNTNLFVECITIMKMNNLSRNRSNVTSSFKGQDIIIASGNEVIFNKSNIACS